MASSKNKHCAGLNPDSVKNPDSAKNPDSVRNNLDSVRNNPDSVKSLDSVKNQILSFFTKNPCDVVNSSKKKSEG